MVIAMAGLQGAGKSALATALGERLGAVVVSVDALEQAVLNAGIPRSFETGLAGYTTAAAVARANLANGLPVVVDAANYVDEGRAFWRSLAAERGAALLWAHVVTPEGLHRERLEARVRPEAGDIAVEWEDVERRRAETEPWSEEDAAHLVVVDGALPLAEQVTAVLAAQPSCSASSGTPG